MHNANYLSCSAKKKKKNLLWIIFGITIFAVIGTITYFAWPKKRTETETKSPTPLTVVWQLQTHLIEQRNQLSQLKEAVQNQETQLADKSYTDTLAPTELTQLTQELATRKQKLSQLENRINELESQLTNFATQTSQDQTKLIQQLKQASEGISQELGIPYKLPEPDNSKTPPDPENPLPEQPDPPQQPPENPPNPTPPNGSPPPSEEPKSDPLAQTKTEALEKLTDSGAPTGEEREKIEKADSPEKVKEELSEIMKGRILANIADWYIIDYSGRIANADSMGLVSYDKGRFLASDYQKIRQAFIKEIESNPDEWKLEKRLLKVQLAPGSLDIGFKLNKGFFFQHQSGIRVHDERGMEFTKAEWEKILAALYKRLDLQQTNFENKLGSFTLWLHKESGWKFFIESSHPIFVETIDMLYKYSGSKTIFFKSKEANPSKGSSKNHQTEVYLKDKNIFACWLAEIDGKTKPIGNFD